MANTSKIEGVQQLIAKLRSKAAKARQDTNVTGVVGYTQSYAIIVHENIEAHHPVGQAKFLEQPARLLGRILGNIIKQSVQQGKTVAQGILLACLRLQRESQQLCPVDTGALKASAFTRLEK